MSFIMSAVCIDNIITLQKVQEGSKTQTCRLVHPGDYLTAEWNSTNGVMMKALKRRGQFGADRLRYQVGRDYAVKMSRSGKGLFKIKILDIQRLDVRKLSDDELTREGWAWHDMKVARYHFWANWLMMYEWDTFDLLMKTCPKMMHESGEDIRWKAAKTLQANILLGKLPARDYIQSMSIGVWDAWQYTFERVNEQPRLL